MPRQFGNLILVLSGSTENNIGAFSSYGRRYYVALRSIRWLYFLLFLGVCGRGGID